MLNTTVGQLLVNEALPEEFRDYNRTLDKKSLHSLLQQVAREKPETYREVSFKLSQIGQRAAQDQGGLSFGLRHLARSKAANTVRQKVQMQLRQILADEALTDQQRTERIIRAVGQESMPQMKAVLDEAVESKNPLGIQVLSGSRGKPMNLASLLASDMLYSDHRDEVIPIPVLRSYSEGLSPEEYWAGTYGARRGIIATKFATQEAGFLSKQLNQAGHRLVVMDEADERENDPSAPTRGLIVDTADMDNEGALLARDFGPYKRNTPLTPKILKHLDRLGVSRILVRSPLVGGSPEGGVYARDVGVREKGTLPGRGEQVGLQAAQALSEPISQGQLSAKHSGGVAGQEKAVGGFQYINQLIQTPKKMQGGAAHATVDGTVQRIEPAPAGGHFVTVNDTRHYVGEGFDLKVRKGDQIEAGDLLSDGIPNPAIITQYKGVGEGRRYFVTEFKKAMSSAGMSGHRRNIELLARGLINHVRLTEEVGDNVPDDIVPYTTLEHTYKPRDGHERLAPKKAVGQYLEQPVLHYTIGTKIRPSMLRNFEEFGVTDIPVHKNPPPFEPHMVRGMYQLQHDPDWMTQMYGSGLKASLLNSVARGNVSEERGTSFIPSLATGTDFGEVADRAVIQPKAPYALPKVETPSLNEPAIKTGSVFFGGRFKLAATSKVPQVSATPEVSTPPSPVSLPAPSAPSVSPSSANQITPNIMPPAQSSVPTETQGTAGTSAVNAFKSIQTLAQPSGPTKILATSRMPSMMDFESSSARPSTAFSVNTAGTTNPAANVSLPSSPMTSSQDNANQAASGSSLVNRVLTASGYVPNVNAAARSGSSSIWNRLTGGAKAPVATASTVSKPATKLLNTGASKIPILGTAFETFGVGSDVAEKGWDAKTDETAQRFRDMLSAKDGLHTLYQAPLQVLSPVENAQMIAGGATQTAGLLGDLNLGSGIYNAVTGTDPQGRAAVADQKATQQLYDQQLQELQAQGSELSPEQQSQFNAIQEKAKTLNDETKNWELGNKNWFGTSYPFRDNMTKTTEQIQTELSGLQGRSLTPQEEIQKQRLAQQQLEYNNLLDLHDREVGYFGTGRFDDFVRNAVAGKKRRLVELNTALTSTQALDPRMRAELMQERDNLHSDLENYRGWSGQLR